MRAVVSEGRGAQRAAPIVQLALFLRTLLFFVAVIFVLAAVPVQPIAFLAGLLTVVPAVIWHGLTASALRS